MLLLGGEALGQRIGKQTPAVTLRKEADKADGSLIEPQNFNSEQVKAIDDYL